MVSKILIGDSLKQLFSNLKEYEKRGWVKIGKACVYKGKNPQYQGKAHCQIIRESNYGA